jgi:hypothetical protein
MSVGLPIMAKAKHGAEGEPKPGPKPTAMSIKGSREWAAWVRRGAKHCRTDTSKLIDDALVSYLKGRGFKEPPPER